jgi:hypothetical protein
VAQVRFIEDLKAVAWTLESLTIEYAEDVEGDAPDRQSRREIEDLLGQRLSPTPKLSLARRRKGHGQEDFHDRFVDIAVRSASGAVRVHELALGRGIEALYDVRKQCTVTYAPPSSSS